MLNHLYLSTDRNRMYSLKSLKAVLLVALISTATMSVHADEYSDVLYRILTSNRSLKSERAVVDVEKSENMTGLNLPNPEVEFAYQWGTPGSSPDKKILDVSQSFDFATLSGGKRRVASRRNAVAEHNYATSRMSVAGDIDRQMTEAVYLTRMANLYMLADTLMSQFEHASQARLRQGDMTPIEYNMVLMQRRNSVTDIALNKIEIESVMSELSRLAGGEMPAWRPTEYCAWTVPADLAAWVSSSAESNPEVGVARAESELATDEVSLRRKEGLPSFSLGYTSEMIHEDNHFGVSVGVELPLWGNHGRVKAAEAAAAAAAIRLDDIQYMQRLDIENKCKRVAALHQAFTDVLDIRNKCGDTTLLDKAYESGAMTLYEYLEQLIALLDIDKRVIETERDYQLALVELRNAASVWQRVVP